MKIGVIGAGTMGCGIAQTFAQKEGYEVYLCDISYDLALTGKKRISTELLKRVAKGKLTAAESDLVMDKITPGTNQICRECDLVIEAALEVMQVKRETFRMLDEICSPGCMFTTNTSSLSITEMNQGIGRPLAGMHFFNPAPAMKLVEIVAGLHTPRETVNRLMEIARGIGKVPIEVSESAGFVVNRLLIPLVNEAAGLYADGTASANDIDTAMQLGANHPMGPLALGDLIGLDVCLAIMEVLLSETGDPKYRPHPLLRKMVRGGKLGRKSGTGFFTYQD